MAALLATSASLALTVVVGQGPPASAQVPDPPTVTVTPTTGLLDADPVAVTVAGAAEDAEVIAQQCATVSGAEPRCVTPSLFSGGPYNASYLTWDGDRHGAELRIQRHFQKGGTLVCGPNACTVRVTVDGVEIADVPITFVPAAEPFPLPDATLSAAPASGLLDRQPVTAVLEHAGDLHGTILRQCGATAPARCAPVSRGIGAETYPRRRFDTPAGEVDCTAEPCSLELWYVHSTPNILVDATPIAFLPEGTYDWGTPDIEASPTTGLHDGESIAVTGEGFSRVPFDQSFLQVCRAVADPDPTADCMTGQYGGDPLRGNNEYVVVNPEHGTGSGQVDVFRYLELPGGWVDCASTPCTMALVQQHTGTTSERVPISFGPEWEPWGSPEAAVDDTIVRWYRRPVDAAERAGLVDDLASGRARLLDLLVRVSEDPSVDGTVGEAIRHYLSFFGRHPDPAGLRYWTDRLAGGLTPDRMARLFAGTPEARATYAGLSTEEIVEKVYDFTLHRAPDAGGAAFWEARLDAGLPLWKLVYHFARSAELRHRTADDVLNATLWFPTNEHLWAKGGTYFAVVYLRR
jgi:hypothetical protein